MPTSSNQIVVDTAPLISLDACDQIDILRQLYSHVVVPRAVDRELSVGGNTALPNGLTLAHRKWIRVRTLRSAPSRSLLAALDRGEAEVITLALQIGCPLVLLDEPRGRDVAREMGLQCVGTLGLLLRAKNDGLLDAIRPSIDLMRSKDIWLGESLIESVLRQAKEIS